MENTLLENKIELDQESLKNLDSIRKWTMFFSVLGFIFIGILVIAGFAAGIFMSVFSSGEMGAGFPLWVLIIIIPAIAAIYFFPVFFLFRFSRHMRNAVMNLSNEHIRIAFRNLKYYFTYIGVLVIIVLAFYFIALVVAGSSLAFFKLA